MDKVTVVSVLKTGGDFTPEHALRLKRGVERNLSMPHRFICLSDIAIMGVNCVPLRHDLPGWWSKIELFWLPQPFLYFDLDTLITGSIDDFTQQDEDFICIEPFYRRSHNGIASGAMWVNSGHGPYETFMKDPQACIDLCRRRADPPWNHGDQRWLEMCGIKPAYWQELLPDQLVSYKVHCKDGLPPDARAVVFHGKPRPDEAEDEWVKQYL